MNEWEKVHPWGGSFSSLKLPLFIIWPHPVGNGKLSSIHVGEFFLQAALREGRVSHQAHYSPTSTSSWMRKTSIYEEALSHPWKLLFSITSLSSGCSREVSSIHVSQFSTQSLRYFAFLSFTLGACILNSPLTLGACILSSPKCMHLWACTERFYRTFEVGNFLCVGWFFNILGFQGVIFFIFEGY